MTDEIVLIDKFEFDPKPLEEAANFGRGGAKVCWSIWKCGSSGVDAVEDEGEEEVEGCGARYGSGWRGENEGAGLGTSCLGKGTEAWRSWSPGVQGGDGDLEPISTPAGPFLRKLVLRWGGFTNPPSSALRAATGDLVAVLIGREKLLDPPFPVGEAITGGTHGPATGPDPETSHSPPSDPYTLSTAGCWDRVTSALCRWTSAISGLLWVKSGPRA